MNELTLSDDLNVITAEIKNYQQNIGQSIFEIGKRLKHVKENDLAHGEWGKWLENIKMNDSYARKYIHISTELWENRSTLNDLGMSALYEISTMSEEEREKEYSLSNGKIKKPVDMTVKEIRQTKRQLSNEALEAAIKSVEAESIEPESIEGEEDKQEMYDEYQAHIDHLNQVEDENDNFTQQLDNINRKLYGKLRDLKFYDHLNIAYWLSKFTKEKQKQIEDIELSSKFKVTFSDIDSFYQRYINYTPINGKQINRLNQLQWKNEQSSFFDKVSFYDDDSFHSKIGSAKTTNEIDSILDEFEQVIEQSSRKKTNQSNSNNSNFDWSSLFGNTSTSSIVNYREELGLSSTASNDEVKKEFRNLMKVLHPDHGGNARLQQKYKEMYDDWRKSIKNKSA